MHVQIERKYKMKIQVIGKSEDMTSYYEEEIDALKEYLEDPKYGSSLREKIKSRDAEDIVSELQDCWDNSDDNCLFRELLCYLIWLLSDFDRVLCQDLIIESAIHEVLALHGINFSLIEMDEQDLSDFDNFKGCTIHSLKYMGREYDTFLVEHLDSYLDLFGESTVYDLTIELDKSSTAFTEEEFKEELIRILGKDNVPKNIKIELV